MQHTKCLHVCLHIDWNPYGTFNVQCFFYAYFKITNSDFEVSIKEALHILLSFLKRTYVSRNALNLNFIKLQYEDFTSCIFTFIYLSVFVHVNACV